MTALYVPQNEPWPHQATALEKLAGREVFALLMAMRTGKSYVTTSDFGRLELAGAVDDMLLIAPAGVYGTWQKDVEKHASLDLLRRCRFYTWSAGQASQADVKRLLNFLAWRDGPRILLLNVEALSSVKRARELAIAFASQRRCYGVVDESTTIKNIDSSRSEFVNDRLRELFAYRRILCGLPTPRSPLDLFGQFWFLDPAIIGYENWKAFERRYADIYRICLMPLPVLRAKLERRAGKKILLEGIGTVDVSDLSRDDVLLELERRRVYVETIPKLKGYKNEEELAAKIAPYSYRVRLEDCYDMPPKTYVVREVTLTEEQKRIYKELRDNATAELAEMQHVTATQVVVRILKLHQVLCGHTIDEEGVERTIPENRTAAVLDLLEEYDGKAIIWCSYDHDVNKVAKALRKKYGNGSVARFWGGNRATRENEESNFLHLSECRFMVATPAAGGRGRTWTVANLLIYYSSTNDLEHRSQSEERASGNLKTDFINCVDLVAPNTVDIKILKALREKKNLSDVITGDDYQEWVV